MALLPTLAHSAREVDTVEQDRYDTERLARIACVVLLTLDQVPDSGPIALAILPAMARREGYHYTQDEIEECCARMVRSGLLTLQGGLRLTIAGKEAAQHVGRAVYD